MSNDREYCIVVSCANPRDLLRKLDLLKNVIRANPREVLQDDVFHKHHVSNGKISVYRVG